MVQNVHKWPQNYGKLSACRDIQILKFNISDACFIIITVIINAKMKAESEIRLINENYAPICETTDIFWGSEEYLMNDEW